MWCGRCRAPGDRKKRTYIRIKPIIAAAAIATGVYLMVIEAADWGILMLLAGVIIHLSGSGSFGAEESLPDNYMSDSSDGDGGGAD